MHRFFAFVGFAGFGLSAVIHVVTFFGVDPMGAWPGLWVFLIVALIALVLATVTRRGLRRSDFVRDPYRALFGATELDEAKVHLQELTMGTEQERGQVERDLVRRFRPRPLVIGISCLALYAGINFVVNLSLLGGGIPEQHGDSFQSTSHGKILKQLTASEYRWHRAYQTRLATGHLMFFLFAAGVLWTAPHRKKL